MGSTWSKQREVKTVRWIRWAVVSPAGHMGSPLLTSDLAGICLDSSVSINGFFSLPDSRQATCFPLTHSVLSQGNPRGNSFCYTQSGHD